MRKLAPTLLLIVGLAACAAPPLPEDHYYRLDIDAPAAAQATSPFAASISVQHIAMTGIYGERPLLYSSAQSPTELHQYHYHYWADIPARLIQEQLADYLRAAHLARDVTVASNSAASDYQVSGTVQRFEQRLDGAGAKAYVALELGLLRTTDNRRLFSKRYRAEIPTRDNTPLAATQGLSHALSQCFAAFVADLHGSSVFAAAASPIATRH
jgi:ABC-type uncharacterized transport system auxiliary subunit